MQEAREIQNVQDTAEQQRAKGLAAYNAEIEAVAEGGTLTDLHCWLLRNLASRLLGKDAAKGLSLTASLTASQLRGYRTLTLHPSRYDTESLNLLLQAVRSGGSLSTCLSMA